MLFEITFTKYIVVVVSIVCTCITSLPAQAIYSGGLNDGFAVGAYLEPNPSADVYSGGTQDGFAHAAYIEPHVSDIYQGGIEDGFGLSSYIQPDPFSDIFRGGEDDGFTHFMYIEASPGNDIFRGGLDDGFAHIFYSEELALPVEWRLFVITKKNGRPLLKWITDKEEECHIYKVLRSHDGMEYYAVVGIDCLGKPFANEYEFEDPFPLFHPIYYYKIGQYDINGTCTYSNVKAFYRDKPTQTEVFYYNRQLIVKTHGETQLKSINVYDFTGRILCHELAESVIDSYFTMNCQIDKNQLVIVKLDFGSYTETRYTRIGN